MATGSDSPPGAHETITYRETLRTPWWWYLVSFGVACLLAAEFHVGGLPLTAWVPFAVLLPLSAVFVWWLGRSRLEVRGGELRIQGAHLPLRIVSGAVGLDPRTLRLVVGREGDPAAFVQIRPWVGPGVQLWLDDPDDPTPYWVVSTRHPDRVLALVRAAG
ncbi:DUF3093 domain-containing protein [uncultured Jatrophihabitans sp.]|uniref:DUF3093 domain-containing protein n=1 Tax=uncultured Jatrophihabitans sp. TaxID=1610747 RepID=UPI0035CBE6B3